MVFTAERLEVLPDKHWVLVSGDPNGSKKVTKIHPYRKTKNHSNITHIWKSSLLATPLQKFYFSPLNWTNTYFTQKKTTRLVNYLHLFTTPTYYSMCVLKAYILTGLKHILCVIKHHIKWIPLQDFLFLLWIKQTFCGILEDNNLSFFFHLCYTQFWLGISSSFAIIKTTTVHSCFFL